MSEASGNTLTEQGVVVAIEGDEVLVETQRSTGCSGCSSESGCGTSALSKLFTSTSRAPLRVEKTCACDIGDRVELTLDESRLLQHSFMAYGLPLIGMFIFAVVLSNIATGLLGLSPGLADLAAIVGGAVGLFLGWWTTRKVYEPVLPQLSKVIKNNRTTS